MITALVLAIAPLTTAGASAPEEFAGWTESEFVAAAQEVGQLSAEEAQAAWEDPYLRERTVVSETNFTIDEPRSDSLVPGQLRAASSQKTFTAVRQYHTAQGVECMAFRIKKTFRYDGVRAYHDFAELIPWVNGWCGYHYVSSTGPTNQYQSIGGIPNSASITSASARFDDLTNTGRTLILNAEGRYNGVTNSWGSTV